MTRDEIKKAGRFSLRPTHRVSVSLNAEEYSIMEQLFYRQGIPMSYVLRAGMRKVLKELKE